MLTISEFRTYEMVTSIHVITWITGVGMETIKRQTMAAYGSLVVGQSVGVGLAYGL